MIDRGVDVGRALRQRQRGFLLNPARFGSGPTDPSFANNALLLSCNGANGSTTFTDLSPTPKTVTVHGDAQITTADSYAGGSCAIFDGTGDWLTAADHADFDFGAGDFTIEWFIKYTSMVDACLTGKRATSGNYGPWNFFVASDGTLTMLCSTDGSSWGLNISTASGNQNTGAWIHGALSRVSGVAHLCSKGVIDTRVGFSGSLMTNSADPAIGAGASNGDFPLNGKLGAFRIKKGVGLYSGAVAGATYTVPAAPFPTS